MPDDPQLAFRPTLSPSNTPNEPPPPSPPNGRPPNGTPAPAMPFVTGLAAGAAVFFLVLIIVCIALCFNMTALRPLSLLLVALAALAAGAVLGFVYGSYGTEESKRFEPLFTLLTGLLTGAGIADLAATDRSAINQGLLVLGAACGFDSGALVVAVMAVFAPLGFMGMYVYKSLTLNVPIAERQRDIGALEARSRKTLTETDTLPKPTTPGGDDKPVETVPAPAAVKQAARIVAQAPGAGTQGTPEKLVVDARAFSALDQTRDAEIALENALRERPDDLWNNYYLARLYLSHSGKEKDAVPLLDKVVHNDPTVAPIAAWKLLGYACLWDPGKLDEALEATKVYLSAYPDDVGTWVNGASALAQKWKSTHRTEHKRDLIDWLTKAVEGRPEVKTRLRQLTETEPEFQGWENDDELKRFLS